MNEINPNYAPWVKKLLLLKLFSPGSGTAWMDHQLLIHREHRGKILGSLDREVIIEMRTKWLEMALPYLDSADVNASDKDKLRKDIECVKWAGLCLDRLSEHREEETWRGSPEEEPAREVETVPAGNEKELELEFAQVTSQPLQSVEFELREQSQPEPTLPPAAPLSSYAQENSEAPEPSIEYVPDEHLFIASPEGSLRRASFSEGAIWLVSQCQEAYERLERTTDLQEIANNIHAQRLANEWADEIKSDQIVRDRLNAILVRSLRRLGQIRAGFRKNGNLKRGQGGKQLFIGLDKHTLQQSDKLAKIDEDEDFEQRLLQKLKAGELTKYSTLQDPPAPKTPHKFGLFFRLLKVVSEDPVPYAEGKYQQENAREFAEIVMGGKREKIRKFAIKLIELLGPED